MNAGFTMNSQNKRTTQRKGVEGKATLIQSFSERIASH